MRAFALLLVGGVLAFYSCDTKKSKESEATETVIDRDTVGTQYEVEETKVKVDTTTTTEKVEKDAGTKKNDSSDSDKK